MEKLSIEAATAWLASKRYPASESEVPKEVRWVGDIFPREPGRRIYLAREISGLFESGSGLFCATDIGLFSSNNACQRFIFDRYLLSGGVVSGVADGAWDTYFRFGPEDASYLEGAIALCFLFWFGGFAAKDDGSLLVGWSHAEYYYVTGVQKAAEETRAYLREVLAYRPQVVPLPPKE